MRRKPRVLHRKLIHHVPDLDMKRRILLQKMNEVEQIPFIMRRTPPINKTFTAPLRSRTVGFPESGSDLGLSSCCLPFRMRGKLKC